MKLLTQKLTLIALAILLVLPGCEDPKETYKEFIKKEKVYPTKPKVTTVPSAVNKVKFFVQVSPDPKLDSIKILNLTNQLVYGAKVDQESVKEGMIDFNFEITFKDNQEGEQTFRAILQDIYKNKSLVEEVSVSILGKRYVSKLQTRGAKVAVGSKGVIFDWSDIPVNSYESTIAYTTASGTAMTKTVLHKTTVDGVEKVTTQSIFSDVKQGSELTVNTFYKPSSEEASGVFKSKERKYKAEWPEITSISPLKGGEGTQITITGKNFHPTAKENKVLFGTVETPVSKATVTSLTIKVPKMTPREYAVTMKVGDTTIPGKIFNIEGPKQKTIEVFLSNKTDDVEESIRASTYDVEKGKVYPAGYYPAGKMHLSSSDLEFGEFDGYRGIGQQFVGVRFRNVNLPKGAKIIKASILFKADDSGSGPCNMRIHGEDAGNSAEYKDELKNLSNRTKTTASVLWNIPAWTKGDKGPAQTTVDLKDIVQEIVSRTDWVANNAMNFILTPEGENVTGSTNGREAETYKGTNDAKELSERPVLKIVYEE